MYVRRAKSLAVLAFAVLLSGCAQEQEHGQGSGATKPPPPGTSVAQMKIDAEQLRSTIEDEAKKRDREIVDGWFYGTEPRIFKTPYGLSKPAQKTDFALDYHAFLTTSGQDMERDWDSYVPYSARSKFARDWWSKRNPEFEKGTPKSRIFWIRESLMDGSELWWRAMERIEGAAVQTAGAMAHDHEMELVSNYSEAEGKPGSYSTQARF